MSLASIFISPPSSDELISRAFASSCVNGFKLPALHWYLTEALNEFSASQEAPVGPDDGGWSQFVLHLAEDLAESLTVAQCQPGPLYRRAKDIPESFYCAAAMHKLRDIENGVGEDLAEHHKDYGDIFREACDLVDAMHAFERAHPLDQPVPATLDARTRMLYEWSAVDACLQYLANFSRPHQDIDVLSQQYDDAELNTAALEASDTQMGRHFRFLLSLVHETPPGAYISPEPAQNVVTLRFRPA